MNILITIECLRVGGAQTFALRLGQALSKDHKVFVYYMIWDYIAKDLVQKIAPDVTIITCKPNGDFLLRKLDRVLYKVGIDFSVRDYVISKHLFKTVMHLNIDIVHSNMFKADYITVTALKKTNVPIITTMHGSYESFLKHFLTKTGEVILNYPQKLLQTFKTVKGIAYLTDRNLRSIKFIEKEGFKLTIVKRKIYNGFLGEFSSKREKCTRTGLSIPDNAIVFGLVARGIPAKGWQETIEAFRILRKRTHKDIYLILVGDSAYVQQLKAACKEDENIKFVGHTENAIDWIKEFDVGLLPSYYNESLPNVIAEYLFCGKPVITTDNGESKKMIEYEGIQAGFVIPMVVEGERVDPENLASHMEEYCLRPELLQVHKVLAEKAFEKFNINKCVDMYLNFYEELVNCDKIQN